MLERIRSLFVQNDSHKALWGIMLIGGVIGLVASFTLSVETLMIAKDHSAILSCDLSKVISCSAVSRHPTASLFGFPNAFLGIISFTVVITVAVAGLMGAKFSRMFMFLFQLATLGGFVFAAWMFSMSYFVIGALCPWCLVTDVGTLLITYSLTRYNIYKDNLYLSTKSSKKLKSFSDKGFDALVAVVIVVLVAVAIILKFGSSLFI